MPYDMNHHFLSILKSRQEHNMHPWASRKLVRMGVPKLYIDATDFEEQQTIGITIERE